MSNGNQTSSGHGFNEDLEALRLSVPVALYVQGLLLGGDTESQRYCHKASHLGVGVLRRLGYRAEVLPCAIMAQGPGWGISVGHTPKSIYETYFRDLPDVPSFEEWVGDCDTSKLVNQEAPMHLAIEAFGLGGERAIVDLSFGQLRMSGYKDLPSALVILDSGWPKFRTMDGGAVAYSECPHPVDPIWLQSGGVEETRALVDFVLRAMKLAHQCQLDPDLFAEAVVGLVEAEGG